MTELQLYNTLSRRLEPFRPRTPDVARVYSCGPTVYSRQHLGNMRPYVLADLLTRVLRLQGLRVEHVVNSFCPGLAKMPYHVDRFGGGHHEHEHAARSR